MKKLLEARLNIIIITVMVVFSLFTVKLVQYQIINGEKYYNKSNASTRINQTVLAARGDILDAYGNPLASSRPVLSVIINKAYMPNEMLNTRLIQAVDILLQQGETINDILPMETDYPYTFKANKEAEITRLKDLLKLNVYATESDVLTKLVERYKLEEIPSEYHRLIGGIRYTMERDGYSADYPFVIAKNVSMETVFIISENSREIEGIEIQESGERFYEDGTLLPHILGTVGPIYAEEYAELKEQGYNMNDIVGKDGLEKTYESYLKGIDGVVQIEKNLYGEIIDKEVVQDPQPGNTLKLTIDGELQKAANEILARQVETLRKKERQWGKECSGASLVVLDVKTGGVLALVNYPGYNLNDYSTNYNTYIENPDKPLFNRALQGLYRPGSVFKVAVATAGLQKGLIDEDYIYTCKGYYDYYSVQQWGSSLPGCAGGRAHGRINVKQALQVSCNCFFYDLGRRLGIDQINETAHNYGLAVKTGLEINEKQGALSSPNQREEAGLQWQAGDVIQASIGQLDTLVTTVQLATYAATIANKGTRLNTHLVKSIESFDGSEIVYETPITVVAQQENINNAFDIVEQGMVMASQEGNAKLFLNDLPYQVATKTGTAQVPGDLYNATIIGYGPVQAPEIAIAVIGEKAGNGYNLAQTVRDIFIEYYRLKDMRENPQNYLQSSENIGPESQASQPMPENSAVPKQ